MNTRGVTRWWVLLTALVVGCSPWGKTDSQKDPFSNDFEPNVNLYVSLGRMHEAAKRYVPAIEAYEKAIKHAPGNAEAHSLLGLAYDRVGLGRPAIQQHKKALELSPGSAWLHNNLGYSYMTQGQHPLAIEQFEKALKLDPHNARYRNNLAVTLGLAGLYQASLEEFRRTGTEAEAHYNLACVHYYLQRWDQADTCFRRALELDSECEEAKVWLDKIRAAKAAAATRPTATKPSP